MKFVKVAFLLGLIWLNTSTTVVAAPPEVTNVVAIQRARTSLVDVTFDVSESGGSEVTISLWYSMDDGVTWDNECLTVSGDVGPGICPKMCLITGGLSMNAMLRMDWPQFGHCKGRHS